MPSSVQLSGGLPPVERGDHRVAGGHELPPGRLFCEVVPSRDLLEYLLAVLVCEPSQGGIVLDQVAAYFHGQPPVRGGEGGQIQAGLHRPSGGE